MQSNESQDGEVAERMRRAVSAAANGTGSRGELEAAARTLVAELRRQNETPERALLQIKAVLAEAGLRPEHATADSSDETPEARLYRDVITWAIKAYYETRDEGRETRD